MRIKKKIIGSICLAIIMFLVNISPVFSDDTDTNNNQSDIFLSSNITLKQNRTDNMLASGETGNDDMDEKGEIVWSVSEDEIETDEVYQKLSNIKGGIWGISSAVPASGKCGDNVYWKLDNNGLLIISGSGDMYSLDGSLREQAYPWNDYRDKIFAVTIEEGVTSVGRGAFYSWSRNKYNNLKSVVFSDSVELINENAFDGCESLEYLSFGEGLRNIGGFAFSNCSCLKSVTIPDTVVSLGNQCFSFCDNLKNVVIADSNNNELKIGSYAFGKCTSLSNVVLPERVSYIGRFAFLDDSSLEQIILPENVVLSSCVFSGTAITSVAIPQNAAVETWYSDESHQDMGSKPFCGMQKLEEIVFENGRTQIPKGMLDFFAYATNLYYYDCVPKKIFIPKSVETIRIINAVKDDKSGLTDIYYGGSKKEWQNKDIQDSDDLSNVTIHYEDDGSLRIFGFTNSSISYTEGIENGKYYYIINTDKKGLYIVPKITEGATFDLYTDINCTDKLSSSYCNLDMGDNFYYVKISKNSDEEICTLYIIRGQDTRYNLQTKTIKINTTSEEYKWGMRLFIDNKANTGSYYTNLAFGGLYLSHAAEISEKNVKSALIDLGFDENVTPVYYSSEYEKNYRYPAYCIGARSIYDDTGEKVIIAIAARGTKNITEGIYKDLIGGGFNGFLDAGNTLYSNVVDYIQTNYPYINKNNIKFFVTGHSLGGAVAGQLGRMLHYKGGYSQDNTYVYTFASPFFDTQSGEDTTNYTNIYNFINSYDIVTLTPALYQKRSGTDLIYYSDPEKDTGATIASCIRNEGIRIAEASAWVNFFTNGQNHHKTEKYLSLMAHSDPYKGNNRLKGITIKCPVDIMVIDNNKQICGYTNGSDYINYNTKDTVVFTDGDVKYVFWMDSEDKKTILFNGTDTGTMDYSITSKDDRTGEVLSLKEFVNVKLEDKKTFISSIENEENVSTVLLYVTDDNNNPIRTVGIDGTENEISDDNKQSNDNEDDNYNEKQKSNNSDMGEDIDAINNKPTSYSVENRSGILIGYYHAIPFYGKSKLTIKNFDNMTISYNGMEFSVSKAKINKKKCLIQINKLSGADKETNRIIKKATKGVNGLPFTINPYYVKDSDKVTLKKKKKDGSIKQVKVNIKGKDYKVKKGEWTYDGTTGLISFTGKSVNGSYKIQ